MWWVAVVACVRPFEDGDLPFPEVPAFEERWQAEQIGDCERRPWFRDVDGDGFGAGAPVMACAPPSGHAAAADDCDDADPRRFPGAPDVCDEVDNDCDPETPDRGAVTDGTYHRTLQGAIEATSSGVVRLCPGVFQASLHIGGELALHGAGAGLTVIEASGDSSVLEVLPQSTLWLSGVTVRGGNTPEVGGGISVLGQGTLVLEDAEVTDNLARDGGGLFVRGHAVLRRVRLEGNQADEQGGGLFAAEGSSVVLEEVELADNKPDAVHSDGAEVVGVEGGSTYVWP